MKIKEKRKLVSSIFVGNIAIILVPIIVVALLINFSLHQYLMNDIAKKDKLMLYSVKQNMESFLQDATDTLKSVDLMADLLSGSEMNREIQKLNSMNNYFENIEVLNKKGIVVNTLSSNESQLGYNRSGEDYFNYLTARGHMYWSTPFISTVTGEPTVTVALGKNDRMIVGYLSLKNLRQLTNKFTEADSDLNASILDSYGRYISSYEYDLAYQRQLEPNFHLISREASSKWPAEFIKGEEQVGFAIKTSSPDWYIVIYDNYKQSMKNIDALLYLFTFLFLTAVIIFIALTFLRTSRINKNIYQFIKQTKHIADGKFDIDIPEQKYDEFNKLASNFKTMAENLKARDQKLEYMAYTDSLTGISNRAYLYHQGWRERYQDADVYGLIFLDIDNFKNINDSYGHTLGDALLIEVAKRLQEALPKKIIFSRFGGDEYVIVVPDQEDRQLIDETIHLIMDAFRKPVKIDHRSFFITVSMGISIGACTDYDFDMMLKAADIAMYQVKGSGKGNYKFYSPEMDKKVRNRLQIEQNLRSALKNNELSLVYQPQVFVKGSKIRGFEALLRWKNKELGQVSPMEFIPIAEETGMIVRIGEWVFRNACETIKSINASHNNEYIMSVNVSPVQFNNPLFVRTLYEIIEETGVRKEWIEIEITENVFLSNIEEVTTAILHLTLNGITISLDDFGTGYSSLSYLNKLPIKTLKIDREFIKNLNTDKNSQNMVSSIILLAHKLEILLVAEGVENQSQIDILNDFSCDCIQGFYYSQPLKSSELFDFLNRGVSTDEK